MTCGVHTPLPETIAVPASHPIRLGPDAVRA